MKKMKTKTKAKTVKRQLLCAKCGKVAKFGNLYRYWMNSTMTLWVCINCNYWPYSEERQKFLAKRDADSRTNKQDTVPRRFD
jgi:hypothetical protein